MHCAKISAEFECGVIVPLGAHPQKCGVGLRRWENQRTLSSYYYYYYYYSTWIIALSNCLSDVEPLRFVGLSCHVNLFSVVFLYFS